jgi:hypothetical protein
MKRGNMIATNCIKTKITKKDMITASRLAIHKEGNNIVFGDNIDVILQDDGAGYYFNINDEHGGSVSIDFEQVEELFEAINILKNSIAI